MYITRFNTKLMHIPGSKMVQSDALSRWPDHVPEEDTDNEDLVLFPDKLFINLVNIKLTKMIESAATSDELVKNMTNILSTKGVPPIKSNLSGWKIEDGMLFYQEWCYIPDNNTIWKAIVQEIHESPMTRNPRRDTTLEMVQRHYWWPRLWCHHSYVWKGSCLSPQTSHPSILPTCSPLLEALDHKKWWSIEWPRVSTYQNRIYKISPDCRCTHLSFFQAL